MSKVIDMTGQTLRGLRIIKRAKRTDTKQRAFWVCQCHCGRYFTVRGDQLRSHTTQCSVCNGGGRQSRFVEEGEVNGTI